MTHRACNRQYVKILEDRTARQKTCADFLRAIVDPCKNLPNQSIALCHSDAIVSLRTNREATTMKIMEGREAKISASYFPVLRARS